MLIKRRDGVFVFIFMLCVCVFIVYINLNLLKIPRFNTVNYPITNLEYEKFENTLVPEMSTIESTEDDEMTEESEEDSDVIYEVKQVPIKNLSEQFVKPKIDKVVDDYYKSMENDLRTIKFSDGSYLDHVPKFGGNAEKIIIMTTWRSGSTFLGELLTSLPGNYYHYEPLFFLGTGRIRQFSNVAMNHVYKLFECDYTNMNSYLEYIIKYNNPFEHNFKLWDVCMRNMDICFNTKFLNSFCQIFPIHTMKIIRLNLSKAISLLSDKMLNLKVIFLLRDPRGTYLSRIQRPWCVGQKECERLEYLCNDLVADFKAAVVLNKLFPKRFRVVRYEELALDPYNYTRKLFDFLQLSMHPKVIEFLDTHTKEDVKIGDNAQSTYRNSKNTPYKWRRTINNTMLHMIETQCAEAMRLWGYVRIENNPWLNDTNLIKDFSLKRMNGSR